MNAPPRRASLPALITLMAAVLSVQLVAIPAASAATLTVADSSADERPGARVNFTINLTREPGDPAVIGVNYTTVSGTATEGDDFLDPNGTVLFDGNKKSETVSVTVVDDALDEDDEQFTLQLSLSSAPGTVVATAKGTILDNDAKPRLSIAGATVDEDDGGATPANFVVTLSGPSGRTVSVTAATSDGTGNAPATAGKDYTAKTQTLSFAPGVVSQVFSVDVLGDALDELDEMFRVELSGALNATVNNPGTATGLILDDDATPTLSISDATETEGGDAVFTVSLSAPSGRAVSVLANTEDLPGQADAGQDYAAASETITFDPNTSPPQTSRPFVVKLLPDDSLDEPQETFLVRLSDAEAAGVIDPTGTGTIKDNDAGPALFFEPVTVQKAEGSGVNLYGFTVKLSQPSQNQVTVEYETVDGSARADQGDYTATSGTLTFLPGALGIPQTFNVAVAGDAFAEADETFTVRLKNPSGGATLDQNGKDVATATLVNDDGNPAQIVVDDAADAPETGGTATFTIRLLNPVPQVVVVTAATEDGTAKGVQDYTPQAGQAVVFAPNETTKTVAVNIVGDALDEDNETFTLKLSNPFNAVIQDGTATGTIVDDDNPPSVGIPTDLNLGEGNEGSSTGEMAVELSGPSGRLVKVNYATADGTATQGADYTAGSSTLTFQPGETRKLIPIRVRGDELDEASPETFSVNLTLLPDSNATLGRTPGVVNIEDDDDAPVVSITGPEPVVEPDQAGGQTAAVFLVSLSAVSGQNVTVNLSSQDGSATAANPQDDYDPPSPLTRPIPAGQQVIEVAATVKGDNADEPNETFDVLIAGATNATVASGVDAKATAVILDNDGAPSLTVVGTSVAEGNPGQNTLANVTIRLTPPAPGSVSVNVATGGGTATLGTDYQAPNPSTVSFPAGETIKTVPIDIVEELVDEPSETFTVTITSADATISGGTADVAILDDDGPTISVADTSVVEGTGSAVEAVFVVRLSAASVQPVAVDYDTAAGSAVAGVDYTTKGGSLLFQGSDTELTVRVPVTGDTEDEAGENFTLTLSNPINATIARGLATATIVDDDQPTLSVSTAAGETEAPSVIEGDLGTTRLTFTLNLNAPTTRESSVRYATTGGRAQPGTDYLAASGRITFAPGETARTVSVTVIGDSLDEANEDIGLILTEADNVTLPGQVIGTILDDDNPGYALVATDGGIFSFGDAGFYGSTGSMKLNQPIVGMAAHPSGRGYWLVAADGGIFAFGEARFHGSTGGMRLNRPIVGMAATPSGNGYWLVATDGGIFAFGDAAFHGSTGAIRLNKPVVGMASTPSGKGYWLVATDGGIFAFGDAAFQGSTGSMTLNQPIVGMASTPSGKGYWLVATDGGIFAFGDAAFHGSTGAIKLNRPVVGMAPTPSGKGYWLVANDGGIFAFGDAGFLGSTGNIKLNQPVVGMAIL